MRNRILVLATLAAAIGTPVAAQAQADVVIGGAPVVVDESAPAVIDEDVPAIASEPGIAGEPGIAIDEPAFREYVVRERMPAYIIPDRVVVGRALPEAGITYYRVPPRFGYPDYRYTVINGETVLVAPHTRRIVEVLD